MKRTSFTAHWCAKAAIFAAFVAASLLSGCNGSAGGDNSETPTTPAASKFITSWDKTSIKSGGTEEAELTITALNANNAAVAGSVITLATSNGVLTSGAVTTDSTGKATVKFNAGSDATNRTETISMTSGSIEGTTSIRVTGSALTLQAATTTVATGATIPLSIELKNGNDEAVSNQIVAVSVSGAGSATVPSSVTTDSNGRATINLKGNGSGAVRVTATGLGNSKFLDITVTGSANNFQITAPSTSPTALLTDTNLTVTVAASASSRVVFATSMGAWDGGTSSTVEKNVAGGTASATFRASNSGTANITVFDKNDPSISTSVLVVLTSSASNATKVSIQATPSVVSPSTSGQQNSVKLIATVRDSNNQPVGNAAVVFEIENPTGGGENVSPSVQLTSTGVGSNSPLGQAQTTFYAGSLPSGQNSGSVKVKATVLLPNGTTVSTPVGQEAVITIGGVAGSVSLGQSSKIGSTADNTAYELAMSAIVADSNGNPVPNAVVNLSAWPIAFSTGVGCIPNNTFASEDLNENLTLDAGEDGYLQRLHTLTFVPISNSGLVNIANNKLDPANSAAGTVPATITTDSNGRASFTYTYLKSNSIWTVVRLRASTLVQGTETMVETKFRLAASQEDGGDECHISDSPYNSIIQ